MRAHQIHEPELCVRQIIEPDQIRKLTEKEREGEND
jgi:hypothetical protein